MSYIHLSNKFKLKKKEKRNHHKISPIQRLTENIEKISHHYYPLSKSSGIEFPTENQEITRQRSH